MAAPRFPLEPLLEAIGRPCMAQLARRVGEHPRETYRWRDRGLSERQADRVACRLGLHPARIWPGWFEVAERRVLVGVARAALERAGSVLVVTA